MATIEKTVELIFAGVDQVTPAVVSIKGGLGDLGNVVTSIAAPISQVTDLILKVDAALAALAVGGLAVSINEAGKFGDSFAEISTLVDATDQDLETFKTDILAYARDSVSSIADINASVYQAISLGIDHKQAIDAVRQAEQLAVAGRADLRSTTELLVGTLNAYGLGMEDAQRFSDAFFTTVKVGKTTIPELAQSISQVTGTAAAAGIPIETLGASIAALTAAGIPTSQSITGLKAAISNIIKPSGEAREEARRLGIQFDASALQSKGLEGVFKEVYAATNGNVTAIGKLFGSQEALNTAIILGRDASGKFVIALDLMKDKAGATETAYQKMANNFALINQNLINNFQATLVQVGTPILEQYGNTAKAVSAVLASIGLAIDAGTLKPLFDALNEGGKKLEEFLLKIAKAMPAALQQVDFTGLIATLKDFGETLLGVFDGVDLTTPEGLAKAIQAAVDTLASLVSATEGIMLAFQPVLDAILTAINEFNKLSDPQKVAFGQNILGAAKLVTDAGLIIGAAIIAIGASGADMKRIFDGIVGAIQVAWNLVKEAIVGVEWVVVGSLQQIAVALNAASFGKIPWLNTLANDLTTFRQVVEEDFANALRNGQSGWDRFSGAIKGDTSVDGLTAKVGGASDALTGLNTPLSENIVEMAELYSIVSDTADSLNAQAQASRIAADDAGVLLTATANAGGAFVDLGGAVEATVKTFAGFVKGADGVWREMENVKISSTGANQAFRQTQQDSNALRLGMAKLNMEFAGTRLKLQYDLQVAKFQQETQQISDAFESITAMAKDAGDQISTLFTQLAGAMGSGNVLLANQIQAQIAREEARRQAEFDLQKSLIEQQIKSLQIRNQIMQQGGGLIQIDSTGLSPALEMVMWEIIEKVQLRVSGSAQDFLLGVN